MIAIGRDFTVGCVDSHFRLPPDDRAWLDIAIPPMLAPAWRGYKCVDLAPTAAKVRRFVFRTAVAETGVEDPPR